MITGYTNNAEKSANTSLEPSSPSAAEISRSNNEMFRQVADLIDKGIKDRVIDLSSYVNSMTTTKLNMMENGKLVLSMTQDGDLVHHAMTPKERGKMSEVLNNQNLTDDQKLDKLTSLINNIAIITQLQMNFEKGMSQGESHSMHR